MRQEVGVFDCFAETAEKLDGAGILLVAGVKGNPMTIGWGTIGRIWGKPIFIVLVRPTRYTHALMKGPCEFTVNVPSDSQRKQVGICGVKSGRDVDKAAECGFTMRKGNRIAVPYIEECPIHYECKTVHTNDLVNAALDPELVTEFYSTGNFHTVYYGEILGVYRDA